MNSDTNVSTDTIYNVSDPQEKRAFSAWIWGIIYTIGYIAAGFFAFFPLGIFFLRTGEYLGPGNLFMPLPLRMCSIPPGGEVECSWNVEYFVMSVFIYLVFLFIFIYVSKLRKLSKTKIVLVLATLIIVPFVLSLPLRFLSEYIRMKIYWETNVEKYYDEDKNIPYAESEIEKLQQNVDFSILSPEVMPYGLLFQRGEVHSRDNIELRYEKDLFSVTVIQTTDDEYSIDAVRRENEALQDDYDRMIQEIEGRKESQGEDYSYFESDQNNAKQMFLESQAYIEETELEGVYFVAYKETESEWRPYVYCRNSNVYLVVRMNTYMSGSPEKSVDEKQKLMDVAGAFFCEGNNH